MIAGATDSHYTVPADQPGTYFYYVEITNTNNVVFAKTASVTSNPAKVTILERVDAAVPVINVQPTGATVVQGAPSPTLTVTASVYDGGELSYQWYVNTNNSNTGGTSIPGATNASYDAPTNQLGTKYYYVVVTNTNEDATGNQTASTASDAAAVTVTRPSGGSSGSGGGGYHNVFIIDPEVGRDIDFEGIHLYFPIGVWHELFTITINKLQNLQEQWQPKEGKVVSDVYDITKNHQGELLKEYTITFPFGLEEEEKDQYELAVYRYSSAVDSCASFKRLNSNR
jgi:hypothetical protein